MAAEFGHDGVHGMLIFFQQHTQLSVLMEQRVVLNYYLRILTFQFRLEHLCRRSCRVRDMVGGSAVNNRTFRDIGVEPSQEETTRNMGCFTLHKSLVH